MSITDTPTEELQAEFLELRGPYGHVPADLTSDEIRAREARLGELYQELRLRRAVPATQSRAAISGAARGSSMGWN